jgi:hypothetical protein
VLGRYGRQGSPTYAEAMTPIMLALMRDRKGDFVNGLANGVIA